MRKQVLCVLVATSTAFLVLGVGGQALAAPVDLTCPFAATITFTPGLGLVSQSQHITGMAEAGTSVSSLTPCSSVVTGVQYAGGSGPVSGTGTLACATVGLSGLTGSANGTVAVTWNNGDTSTITWSVTLGGAFPVVSASVISGALRGSTVSVAPTPTGLTGNCLLAPVTSVSFAGAVVFSRL
jgi:hypothetical protein